MHRYFYHEISYVAKPSVLSLSCGTIHASIIFSKHSHVKIAVGSRGCKIRVIKDSVLADVTKRFGAKYKNIYMKVKLHKV